MGPIRKNAVGGGGLLSTPAREQREAVRRAHTKKKNRGDHTGQNGPKAFKRTFRKPI